MPTSTTYYLGKVIKLGNLKLHPDWIEFAFFNPRTVVWWGNSWSFFDVKEKEADGVKYFCAKLSKFNPKGEVIIADLKSKQEIIQPEPNLQIASSYFIYIPSLAGLAFAKVPNQIDEYQFPRLFCRIINETLFERLAECQIEYIADLHSFAEKLLALDGINAISAKIFPPNPIFGPLWEPLKEYIRNRRSEKMLIREDSGDAETLNTELPAIVEKIVKQTNDKPFVPKNPLPIGDAAILMAADGYGSGLVKGRRDGKQVQIKTSETIKNFTLPEEHAPEELFKEAYAAFKKIEKERHMKH
jgi:hypothetical protein